MRNRDMQDFMVAVLGDDAAGALAKATERSEALGSILAPRTILGWLAFASRWDYSGQVPGIDDSHLEFRKSEATDLFSGTVSVGEDTYDFEHADMQHLAAALSVALGVAGPVSKSLRDQDLVSLGQNIDLLVRMRVVNDLQKAQQPGTMSVADLLVNKRGLQQATYNTMDGRGSRTEGPLSVWKLEDGRHLLVDGHHRLVDHLHRGATSVPYKVVGEGYTDYYATPMPEDSFQYKRTKYGGLEAFADNGLLSRLGKTDMPGQAAAPKKPLEPESAEPPKPTQPKQTLPPKPTSIKVTKSQAESLCSVCEAPQFTKRGEFLGCYCLRGLAKHATASVADGGYAITVGPEWTKSNVALFMDIVGPVEA